MDMDLQNYQESLLSEIATLKNEVDLAAFFSELLTKSESESISARWAILNEVKKNTPQRKIAQDLGVSLAKVNRCAKTLKKRNGFLRSVLERKYDETSL